MAIKLQVTSKGDSFDFTAPEASGMVTIGRSDENDIVLKSEKQASRKHCTLERTVDGWKVVDQMSANGTSVNKEKVNFKFLSDNDRIMIGSTVIVVTGLADAAPTPAKGRKRQPAAKLAPAKLPTGGGEPQGRRAAPAQKKFPVGAVVGGAIGILALVVGGGFLFMQMNKGSGSSDQPEKEPARIIAKKTDTEATDKDALARAEEIASSTDPIEDRLTAIGQIDRSRLSSKAESRLLSIKQGLINQLDETIQTRVKNDLEAASRAIGDDNTLLALDTLDTLDAWINGNQYVVSLASPYKSKVADALVSADKANNLLINEFFDRADVLSGDGNFDEAIEVLKSTSNHARVSEDMADAIELEIERYRKIRAGGNDPVVEKPDETKKKPSILDKVKKDERRLPDRNPLLPKGKASERELIAAIHGAFIDCANKKTLKDSIFTWDGMESAITRADENEMRVAVEIDMDGDVIVGNRRIEWKDVDDLTRIDLYLRMPEITSKHELAMLIMWFDLGRTKIASHKAWQLWQREPEWKDGIDILIATKRRIEMPKGGFIEFEESLMTPSEKEEILFRRHLASVLERFEKGIDSKNSRKKADSEKAFQEIVDLGERAVEPAVEIMKEIMADQLEAAKKATGLLASNDRMDALYKELQKRRAHALDLIMDEVRYPYPYGPNKAEVQADVNERVAAVREIWNNPLSFSGKSTPQLDAIITKVRAIAERMAQLDPEQKYYESTPDETVEYIRNIANDKMTIKEYIPDNKMKEKKVFNYNKKVFEYNKNFPTGDGHADGESRAQVRVTNLYRHMFGRHCVKINDKLYWAAKHHSQYCVQHNGGQIAHVIQGEPKGASPGDRMRHEGYGHPGGENIHMNSAGPTAQSSHDSWCQSSGHHRNILHPRWRVLGSARFGNIWTQNFGAIDEGDGNTQSKGGQ